MEQTKTKEENKSLPIDAEKILKKYSTKIIAQVLLAMQEYRNLPNEPSIDEGKYTKEQVKDFGRFYRLGDLSCDAAFDKWKKFEELRGMEMDDPALINEVKSKPELSIQDEGLDEWKRKKISKILEDANGSWVDLVTDGFDLGIEYYKQLNKPVYPNESVIGVKFEDRVQVKWEENMK